MKSKAIDPIWKRILGLCVEQPAHTKTQFYDLAYGKYNNDVEGACKKSVVIWDFEYLYLFCALPLVDANLSQFLGFWWNLPT